MKRSVRSRTVIRAFVAGAMTLAIALGTMAASTGVARADNPPGADIEVQVLHCIDTDDRCNTPKTATNSLYTQVEAIFTTSGKISGTPDAVDFTCGRAYLNKTDGMIHFIAQHVFTGPTVPGFDPGTIRGSAELEHHYSEEAEHAESEMNITAHDSTTGDTAQVSGELVTNNESDTAVSGGYNVEIHGPIFDELFVPNQPPVIKVIGHGEMECSTFGKGVAAPWASGPFFEAVVNNSDCTNPALPTC